jgi:hypothetical protein
VSWLFSQALVAESLGENCLDGKPSVQSKSTATAPVYYVGDKTKEFSRLSRFGMTLQPLTADRGEALLTSFQEAFLAKTFQLPEEEQALPENVQDSGVRWRELSVKYDQDLSSWRTHQCLFQEVLEESSLTLPRWGLMRNGELSERTTPEHLTNEIESGFWPTPRSSERAAQMTMKNVINRIQKSGYHSNLEEAVALEMWPTPTANNYEQTDLDKLLERRERIKSQGINGNGFGLTLANAVLIEERKTWATPTASEVRQGWQDRSRGKKGQQESLSTQVIKEAGGREATSGLHLNPDWTEWLMGWPIGWTDSKQLGTDRFQQWWNSHGKHSEAID